MLVRDLMDALRMYPPGALVVMRGVEGGFDDVDLSVTLMSQHVVPRPSLWGKYDTVREADVSLEAAVLIERKVDPDPDKPKVKRSAPKWDGGGAA